MNRSAEKAVTKARTQLLLRQRFYGMLALNLIVAQSEAAASTATEGTHYFYNPDFIESLTEPERVGSWGQAVMNCAYKHPMRRQWREPRRWSLACAHVVNLDLTAAGYQLPPGSVVDARFLGMAAEEVYELLEQKQQDGGGGAGDGSGQDQGQGAGGSGDQPGDEDGDPRQKRTPEQQEHDPGGAGEILDATEAFDTAGNKDASDRWDKFARQALAIAKAANAGELPGDLKRFYDTLNEPRVDWREMTRDWAQNSLMKSESWSRPNRRYFHMGLYLPGQVSDRPNHIVLIGDSSGSMTQRLWDEIATEIKAMLDEGVADKITVVYTDTKFQGSDVFETGDELRLNPKGGGGTHFLAVWKWVEENVPDATGVVFFTDLLTNHHGTDPGIPVLWAVHGRKSAFPGLASKVPFGDTLFVDYH
jgi:predicted metal-dependent peptidase